MRILLANEPRAYREVIAAALRGLRPRIEVFLTEPEDLDAAVLQRAPHLVVCSQLTEVVRTRALTWIVLYPGGTAGSEVSLAGRRTTVAGLDLDDLLNLLDQTARLVQSP